MNLRQTISLSPAKATFIVFATLIAIGCWLSAAFESILPLGIPAFGLLVYWTIIDFKAIFYILLACIPISTEVEFSSGLSTDLPTEPLIVGLMLVYLFYSLKNGFFLRDGVFFRHSLTLVLLLHIGWMFITVINSDSLLLSVKYFLAKGWYVITFYFLAGWVLQTQRDYERFIWYIFIPLSIALIITIVRHAGYGFSFKDINKVMSPMFRNHVTYGCILAIFLPFIIFARTWQRRYSGYWWMLSIGIFVFLLGIQLSFTRAAYAAIVAAGGYFFIVKYRLTKYVVAAIAIGVIVFTAYLVNGNKYLDFAPKYEKAITHESFDNLLEATAKGEDVSTMERVYRWVAGFRMVADKPYMGVGPNNFVQFYKKYTVTNFKTYVSDNKENSTVHCYYLLIAIEQGIAGAIIFFLLIFWVLLKGEQVYHNSTGFNKGMAMTVLLSFVILLILLLINDLVETDKFGSFFFMCMAIITNLDIASVKTEPTQS